MIEKFKKFHEKETFYIKLSKKLKVKLIKEVMENAGFKQIDDFFSLKRQGEVMPWQSINLTQMMAFLGDEQNDLDDEQSEINRLEFSYFFASTPFEYSSQFVELIFLMSDKLEGNIYHNGVIYTKDLLKETFQQYCDEVILNLEDLPGTESVGINLQNSYPR